MSAPPVLLLRVRTHPPQSESEKSESSEVGSCHGYLTTHIGKRWRYLATLFVFISPPLQGFAMLLLISLLAYPRSARS